MSTESTVACKSCQGTGNLTVSRVLPLTIACSVCKGVGCGRNVEVPFTAWDGARGLDTVFKPAHELNEAAPGA